MLFPAFEVDDPETVNTTDISFIALWSDDQGVERVVLFEQLLPCPVLGIKVEETAFSAEAKLVESFFALDNERSTVEVLLFGSGISSSVIQLFPGFRIVTNDLARMIE